MPQCLAPTWQALMLAQTAPPAGAAPPPSGTLGCACLFCCAVTCVLCLAQHVTACLAPWLWLRRGDIRTRHGQLLGSTQAQNTAHPRQFVLNGDAEHLLEKHAQWLRSLREQITRVSRPNSRANISNSGNISEATPVKVRVAPDRELIIRVQTSSHV